MDSNETDKITEESIWMVVYIFCPKLTMGLITQIDHEVLVYLSFPLEAGCEQEHPVVNGDQRKWARRLDIQLLRRDKLAPLGVPLVDLRQWIIAAQDGVLPVADGDRLEHHRATGRKCLDLLEHGTVPAHHLGVPDESCQAYKQLTFEKDKDPRDCLVYTFSYSIWIWNGRAHENSLCNSKIMNSLLSIAT